GAGYGELGAALAGSIPLATMLLLGVSKLLEILFGESRRTGYPVVRDCRLAGIAARSDPAKLKALRRRPGKVRVYGIASKNLVAAYPD
nr:hypothetical protein [Desulfurococcales archaeon]